MIYAPFVCLSVCLSVTFVTLLSQLKLSAMFLRRFVAQPSNDYQAKCYEYRPREISPSGVKRRRGSHIELHWTMAKAISRKRYVRYGLGYN